jgi:methionine-rich copper-binding protein CopC
MPKLESGDYRIKWLVIGDDTHEIRGEFTFTVEDKTE